MLKQGRQVSYIGAIICICMELLVLLGGNFVAPNNFSLDPKPYIISIAAFLIGIVGGVITHRQPLIGSLTILAGCLAGFLAIFLGKPSDYQPLFQFMAVPATIMAGGGVVALVESLKQKRV